MVTTVFLMLCSRFKRPHFILISANAYNSHSVCEKLSETVSHRMNLFYVIYEINDNCGQLYTTLIWYQNSNMGMVLLSPNGRAYMKISNTKNPTQPHTVHKHKFSLFSATRVLLNFINSIQILTAHKWDSTKYIVRSNLDFSKMEQLKFDRMKYFYYHTNLGSYFVLYHDITCVCFRQQDSKNYPMTQITEIMI